MMEFTKEALAYYKVFCITANLEQSIEYLRPKKLSPGKLFKYAREFNITRVTKQNH